MTVCPEASHFAAGSGARTDRDGVDTGGIIINTTANIPSIEATEAEYPVLYLFRRQLRDSGGAGMFRGGVSAGLALIPHDAGGPLESSFSGVGAEVPNAYGLAGGLPGAAVRYLRYHKAAIEERLARGEPPPLEPEDMPGRREIAPVNNSHSPFPLGMVEYHNWQGGGGYGDPLDRDPDLVLRDVVAGLVSPEMARRLYGTLVEDGGVNRGATEELRERMRDERRQAARPAEEVLGEEPEGERLTGWMADSPG
jgi:N-methylhydantoinase B